MFILGWAPFWRPTFFMRFSLIVMICLLWNISMGQQRANVIYIYADDLGYGELGCYGQQKIKTPNLDKLASEGVRFTQHYTSSPVCAPARCMLLTGRHAGHGYIRGNYELGGFADHEEGGQMPLHEGAFTVGKLMKLAGYTTACIGKWGLGMAGGSGDPNRQGFDYFYGYLDQKQAHNHYPTHLWENGKWDSLPNAYVYPHQKLSEDSRDTAFAKFRGQVHAMDRMGSKALTFIESNRHRPFFLYLPLTAPHLALQAPEDMVNMYRGRFPEKPYFGEKGYTPARYPLATYAAMITALDREVGRVMQKVKELGLDSNTVIMFSSDNGPTFDVGGVDTYFFNSAGGLRGRKQDLYEGGIRVPFLARWPGVISAGRVSGHVSAQYDLMATLAEMVGLQIPSKDGISFLPELKGDAQMPHQYLYFEFPEKQGQVAIRMGRWKGVRSNMKKDPQAPWEVYDLETDPSEEHDVSAAQSQLVARFSEILNNEHNCSHLREWEFVDPKFPQR